jgi:hypothetical protein
VRYKRELGERIKSDTSTDRVLVQPGDTLQKISQRLYGTTRLWTELYLVNGEKIQDFNKLAPGTELSYYKHADSVNMAAMTQNTNTPVTTEQVAPEVTAAPVAPVEMPVAETPAEVTAAPTMAAAEAAPMPQSESLPQAEQTPAAAPMVSTHTPAPIVAKAEPVAAESDSLISSANIRKVVYVLLVLLVGAIAHMLTSKSGKKSAGAAYAKNMDMLDMSGRTPTTSHEVPTPLPTPLQKKKSL